MKIPASNKIPGAFVAIVWPGQMPDPETQLALMVKKIATDGDASGGEDRDDAIPKEDRHD